MKHPNMLRCMDHLTEVKIGRKVDVDGELYEIVDIESDGEKFTFYLYSSTTKRTGTTVRWINEQFMEVYIPITW